MGKTRPINHTLDITTITKEVINDIWASQDNLLRKRQFSEWQADRAYSAIYKKEYARVRAEMSNERKSYRTCVAVREKELRDVEREFNLARIVDRPDMRAKLKLFEGELERMLYAQAGYLEREAYRADLLATREASYARKDIMEFAEHLFNVAWRAHRRAGG